jgi:uncharacterized protein YndB with AHSA1/START domain
MTNTAPSNEIEITRIYDAPVQAVWDAWTDPDQVAQWWGPRGFTLTTHSKDLRPGGHWSYTMHGPDGVDYPNRTHYFEVEPYARLVYDHGANDNQPPLFRVTVVFTDLHGKTKMEMRMTLPTPEAAAETKVFIKKAGGNSTWDRLAEFLEKESSDNDVFVINRTFEAPINVLFDMWTDPQHLAQWLPPTGSTMRLITPDIRVGGTSFYSMSDGNNTMYGRITYLEINRPSRIVYTQQFSDEHGNVSRYPAMPTWPETMRTNVVFAEEGPAQTRVTVTWEVVGPATREEMETFINGRAGMTVGWTGSFDKLETYLTTADSSVS